MKVKFSLLEDLANLSHRPCLSDLHNIPIADLIATIETMNLELYSLEEWNYGLSYVFRTKIKLNALSDIIQTLISFKQ